VTAGDRFPHLQTQTPYVALRAVRQEDVEPLRIASVEVLGPGWRTRGVTQSPGAFESALWATDVQYLAVSRQNGAVVSWLSLYSFEPLDQVAYCAVARLTPPALGRTFMSSLVLFLDYCFRALSLRKVFFEVAEYNGPAFRGLVGDPLSEEGRLRKRYLADGRSWDLLMYSLTHEQLRSWRMLALLPDPWVASDRVK